jgi:hypothetical protein
MILVPRNNFIDIIQKKKEKIRDIKLFIDDRFLENKNNNYLISFNGKDFIPFFKGMFIPKEYQELNEFKLKLRYSKDNQTKEFSSNPINSVRYFGIDEENIYSDVVNSLLERVSTLEKEFSRLLTDTKLLRDVVRDIHEEGDII